MSRLCLSVTLLVLLVTLVSCTPQDIHESHAKGVSQPAFCLQPHYRSPCWARNLRYYYNASSGHCEVFIYGGCLGKKNNFRTAMECIKTCSHEGTPGEPGNGTLLTV